MLAPVPIKWPPTPVVNVPPLLIRVKRVSVLPLRLTVPLLSTTPYKSPICSLASHFKVPPLTVAPPPIAFTPAVLFRSNSPALIVVVPV